MSNPWANQDPQTFLAMLPARERDLQKKTHEASEKGQIEDAVKFAEARRLLYERANSFPLRDQDKMLISNMAHEAATQVILYQMWKQFGDQTAAIISRLDTLENDVKELKEKIKSG